MSNSIIREHGNMLDVSINGKFQTVPKCTCGKCIVRRLRENLFTPFPYAKDLATTYKTDYDWKTNPKEDPDLDYNPSKHNSFEGAYKEHIPTSLISTAKMSYKPFKVKEDKRTYFQYYWSLLKKKQLILFTFWPANDYNLLTIKISLFLLSFGLYFSRIVIGIMT